MGTKIKILIVGEVSLCAPTRLVYDDLLKLGNEPELIDTLKFFKVSLLNRVVNKFLKTPHYFGPGVKKLNRFIIERASAGKFEYVLFFKPSLIYPRTILELKKSAKILGIYMDHVDFLKSGSDHFYKTLPMFDLYMSTIHSNTEAMYKYGAKRSTFFPMTADSTFLHPVEVSPENMKRLGADVIFIGNYANEKRADYLERLCKDGYDVRIYGYGWQNLPADSCLRRKKRIFKPVLCTDMAEAFSAAKIGMAFMRECNDEKIGCRTYEIPLCGTFMLHERNKEVEEFLIPDKEAAFFDSYEEMKSKIDFYLKNPEIRKKVAKAGYERILNCGELIYDQMRKMPAMLKKELG
ncbi:MAG: glycosyltransferase [Minisyncoccia bacterium]|jgi:glycosyltransferase involved in cell wall biosynthesis